MNGVPVARRGKLCFLLGLVLVLGFCGANNSRAAKDYSIQSVIIDARLNSDGSMNIVERRTYQFNGHFHWATYSLPTDKTAGVADFSVGEDGRLYSEGHQEAEGTYQYQETPGSVNAEWFFDAQNQARTFMLSYRILDVVKVYQDAAVLYYQFVGTGWDKPSQQVEVTIYPPERMANDGVKAWAHGPLWGTISTGDDGSVVADVRSLPAKTFWEVRAIYPISSFPQVKNLIPQEVIPTILAEEKTWAGEANRRREEWIKKQEARKTRKKYGSWIVLAISGIGFLAVFDLYNRHGKRHKVPFPDTLYSEFPSDIPPALLSYLLFCGQVKGQALVGTLLDLARRGFLKIKEETKTAEFVFWPYRTRSYTLEFDRTFYAEHKRELQAFEHDLLTFIFDDLAEGQNLIDFKTLTKSRREFIRWFREWKREVVSLGESKGYWEKESLKARNWGIAVSLALFAVAIASAFLIAEWTIIPAVTAIILLIWSLFIPRRRPEFELEAKKWKALRRYLKKYQFRDSGSPFFLENVGKFLVYGVVLGLPKEVVKKMAEMIPDGQYSGFVPWYVASQPYADFSPAGFGEALSSLMTAASTTMSSASGTGGGASGGGGGGAGGSGGGAG
ncbi:MAG: DUF2207 domain-containing protein [Candidatus Zixiibacteriota bacterium]